MKLIGFIFLCLATSIFPKNIFALSETVDQKCRVTTDLMEPIPISNAVHAPQQSFVPTYDHLTKIALLVNGDGVGSIKLWLVEDWAGGNFFVSSSGEVPKPNGKAMVYFNFDNLSITPGKSYMIMPGSTDYSKLDWYSQQNCYANGSAHLGDIEQSYDFAFQTYGYSSTASQLIPISLMPVNIFISPTPILIKFPTSTPTPTSVPPAIPTSIKILFFPKRTATATVTPTPTNIVPTSNIIAPVVEEIYQDLEKVDTSQEAIDLSNSEEFVLEGTGEAGSKIFITFGKNSYEVLVDSNGRWSLPLPLSDVQAGKYTITGQTQKDGEVGGVVDLTTVNLQQKSFDKYPYIIGALIILISLTVLGMLVEHNKHLKKNVPTPKTK